MRLPTRLVLALAATACAAALALPATATPRGALAGTGGSGGAGGAGGALVADPITAARSAAAPAGDQDKPGKDKPGKDRAGSDVGPAAAIPGCAAPRTEQGEWRSYGHDLHNTRSQPAEKAIGPETVGELGQAWRLDVAAQGMTGVFHNTPVIADGCVFGATHTGWVFAANADTGTVLWKRQYDLKINTTAPDGAQADGVIVGSAAVKDGRVFVVINRYGAPFMVALDEATGATLWSTDMPLDGNNYSYGSPQLTRGLVLTGLLGNSTIPRYRGAVAGLDEGTGELLFLTPVIPDEDFCNDDACTTGFAGGSVWATGAIDESNGYAYFGTGNPSASRPQHPRTNAILKVDVDRTRPTFGQILDSYAGTPDNLVDPSLDNQPVCQNQPTLIPYPANSLLCVHTDLDFGASPNLFTDSTGRLVVGELQKSGRFHAADATTMDKAWETVVGAPCFPCNASSSAFDGERVLVVGAPPGQLFGLAKDNGKPDWVSPVADGLHYESVSTAGGVTYTTDGDTLFAYDNATGDELTQIGLGGTASNSGGGPRTPSDQAVAGLLGVDSGGVAIARGKVYVGAGGSLVALGLGVDSPPAAPRNPPTTQLQGASCVAAATAAGPGICEFTTRNPAGAVAVGTASQSYGSYSVEAVTAGCTVSMVSAASTGPGSGSASRFQGSGIGVFGLTLQDACTYRLTVNSDGTGAVYAGQIS